MAGLLVVMFMQCNVVVAVCMICLVVMLNGSATSGYLCSHQDLAPNLAGTLMGLTNTVGALAGAASPILTGYIIGEIVSYSIMDAFSQNWLYFGERQHFFFITTL